MHRRKKNVHNCGEMLMVAVLLSDAQKPRVIVKLKEKVAHCYSLAAMT